MESKRRNPNYVNSKTTCESLVSNCLSGLCFMRQHYFRWTKCNSMYTKFFFEEFIPFIDANYRIDSDRRALSGFSMGGFGSFHYALTKPEMFKSVSSLSGTFPHTEIPSKKNKKSLGAHNWSFWKNTSKGIINFHWKHFKDDE